MRDSALARALKLILCCVLLAAPAGAAAEEPAYRFGNRAEAFVLGGLTGGGSFGSLGGGGYLGGEVSVVWLKQALWGGLYVDGAYDFGHRAATFTAGPEFGWGLFGIDGGPGLRLGIEDVVELGYHGRLLIGLGTFALYGRYGYWPNAFEQHVGQVGVLLKLPFWNSTRLAPIAR